MKKIVAAIIGVAIVAFLGYSHRDQITARMSCAEKVAHQFASAAVVPGAWECIDPPTKDILLYFNGVKNAKDFAQYVGYDGSYTYLGETNDGGYTYRMDWAGNPHSEIKGALEDLTKLDPKGAWSEINGETQGWLSVVGTFYLYPPGTVLYNLTTKQSIDVSGLLYTIK